MNYIDLQTAGVHTVQCHLFLVFIYSVFILTVLKKKKKVGSASCEVESSHVLVFFTRMQKTVRE